MRACDIMFAMSPSDPASDDLPKVNAALAEWAARSATESDALIERLEGLGYAVRGKSEDEISEILKHPPTGHTAA